MKIPVDQLRRLKVYLSLTVTFITISVIVALISNAGSDRAILMPLLIASPGSGGAEILSGQVWRLLTPIFIHFGLLHLVFNMYWLWDLGNLIEIKRGPLYFSGFVVSVGIASNLSQYLITGSPTFGGMSGVVYGLFGYLWMQGRYNPNFDCELLPRTVVIMLGWFVLCWTGLLGPIANWAHTAGLVIGVVWGYLRKSERLPAH